MRNHTHETTTPSGAPQVGVSFEVGDDVILDTGEAATIACIYRDFAWVFASDFETVEISSLRRLNLRPAIL